MAHGHHPDEARNMTIEDLLVLEQYARSQR